MSRPAEVLERGEVVLLDFDGPVCAVFGGLSDHNVANELRALFPEALPEGIERSRDPFDLLEYAVQFGDLADQVERRLSELEVRAVTLAPATPGAADVLKSLRSRGVRVMIVSNNSEVAVSAYLHAHELDQFIDGVSARAGAEVAQLKPSPFLLRRAMRTAGVDAADCVMIGDSVTDIEAARAAGTPVIAYANETGKRERFARYEPTAVIDHMADLLADL